MVFLLFRAILGFNSKKSAEKVRNNFFLSKVLLPVHTLTSSSAFGQNGQLNKKKCNFSLAQTTFEETLNFQTHAYVILSLHYANATFARTPAELN
jgi:hypothetical protein